ncbi:MAG TPA: substrate-binding domain-containing protein [Acidobacteriaceae bacterium]
MTKHQQLFEALQHQILQGKYAHNRRLPSESELALRFHVSRPTAARALKDLQALGIITRRAGSGSFLTTPAQPVQAARNKTFGLLVPGLGKTEILDPICNEITRFAQLLECTVLWGDAAQPVATGEDALHLCEQYIRRGVDGIFFAPMETVPDRALWNQRIADALVSAGIPMVLLDRDLREFPARSNFDLIGIDNFRAAVIVTQHLLEAGCCRLCFLARPEYPSTTDLRLAGCREAANRDGNGATVVARFINPDNRSELQTMLQEYQPDGILCANDQTAALLLRSLNDLGVRTPSTVRVAGFDDVQYATLLAVPLTTIRQPCREIARAATLALLERTNDRSIPAREILLPFELIIRQSSGS